MKNGITFNVYLEDWSGGMIGGVDYVDEHIEALSRMPVKRIMLPDTLGLLSPAAGARVRRPHRRTVSRIRISISTATTTTVSARPTPSRPRLGGAHGVHVTVNGMGERAGNVTLDEVVVALRDHAGIRTSVDERALSEVSKLVEVFSGRRVPPNKPIVGENVFTQTAGIHADGDMKGNLYESRLTPARFGQHRTYAMGKLMGKASLDFNLERLNITLSPEQKQQLLARIVELGDQKKSVTQVGPAVPDFGSAADARAARVRSEGLLRRQQPGAAADRHDAGAVSATRKFTRPAPATADTTPSCRR